jgi:hypothetical protein
MKMRRDGLVLAIALLMAGCDRITNNYYYPTAPTEVRVVEVPVPYPVPTPAPVAPTPDIHKPTDPPSVSNPPRTDDGDHGADDRPTNDANPQPAPPTVAPPSSSPTPTPSPAPAPAPPSCAPGDGNGRGGGNGSPGNGKGNGDEQSRECR